MIRFIYAICIPCVSIKGFVASTNHMPCIDPAGGTYSAAIMHKAKASAGNEKYQA